MKQLLVNEAEEQKAAYPQFRGHWDGWVVAKLKREIRSRGATVGNKDDFVLLDPESFTTPDHPDVVAGLRSAGFVTVYLPRHYAGGCDTSVKATDVEVLA